MAGGRGGAVQQSRVQSRREVSRRGDGVGTRADVGLSCEHDGAAVSILEAAGDIAVYYGRRISGRSNAGEAAHRVGHAHAEGADGAAVRASGTRAGRASDAYGTRTGSAG